MKSGRTGSAKRIYVLFGRPNVKNFNAQSFFGAIASFLKFLGQPVLQLLLVTCYLLLVTFTLVGKITLWIATRSTRHATRKTKFLFSRIPYHISRITYPVSRRRQSLWRRTAHITFPRFPFRFLFTKKFLLVLLVSCFVSLVIYNFYFHILYDLPSPDQLITRQPILTTKIYDRRGTLLYKIYRQQNRTLVKLKDIPLFMQQATIAIEDKDFYRHQGLSPKGIARALYRNLFYGSRTGGSTITQQLVKNALLTPEKTLQRKVKEIVLALLVETKFSKDEILQMYLNEVPYGSVAYGVEEAAQTYFGKSVKEINLAEAALLAGLPTAPTRYSPFGAHPELAKFRQKQVLEAMVKQGYIDKSQESGVRSQELKFTQPKVEIRAPHFIMYVKDLLVKKYGQQMVEEGGLEVITSLDLNIQEMAQQIVTNSLNSLKSLNISNGAALVTDPKTGEILAMVGSKNYFDTQNEGNFNVVLSKRQPGSSIKPVNYAVALQNGFTPATIIPDTPITYRVSGQPPYSPRNYDNRFHGNTTLRVALASSYNVPAVKVLSTMGVNRMIEQGQKMGITTWEDPSQYGLSLTLGGGEVKMVDMAVAYGSLANLGMRVDLNPILGVRDYRGKLLEDYPLSIIHYPLSTSQALPPNIAYILTDILSDNQARTPAFGSNSLLNISDHKAAVKTGTTNNLRDNWCIGFTPSFLVAAWVGNNNNSPMSYVASGVTGATPIWHQIMSHLLAGKPNENFLKPEGLVEVTVCGLTNTLTCRACPNPRTELFLPSTEPKYACNEEIIKKILSPSPSLQPSPRIGP